MSRPSDFPFLLQLLDDPSEVVQVEVRKAFFPLANELPELLAQFPATPEQTKALHQILYPWRKARLLLAWSNFLRGEVSEGGDPTLRRSRGEVSEGGLLELHQLLSDFHELNAPTLSLELGRLAEEYQGATISTLPERLLSNFQGNQEDYYDPRNSVLSQVLTRRLGNPITLCSLLILVGKQLGLDYGGCPFPGHFLASFEDEQGLHLVDAFRGGILLPPELTPELKGELSRAALVELTRGKASTLDMAARIVRNLVAAYSRLEQTAETALFQLLLKYLQHLQQTPPPWPALREPLYWPGQLVRHRQKDYRGVVVDYEIATLPTYRVLVHGSPQVASASEDTLMQDQEGGLVAHPFLSVFFTRFDNGMYVRNSKPWEGER